MRRTNGETPIALGRAFRLLAFDWDGTAVSSRLEEASATRAPLERLLGSGVLVVVVTGTSFQNVHAQLSAWLPGHAKQNLFVAANRGSEVIGFEPNGHPRLVARREATAAEDLALDDAANTVREALAGQGLEVDVVRNRLNRRKIDLIPTPEWRDPPKSAMGELLRAVEARLAACGIRGGLREVFELTERAARDGGLVDARVTSDVKHLEVGLTDKADSVIWAIRELAAPRGIARDQILIAGDEFGPVAGFPGSDHRMIVPECDGAVVISVGPEPGGVPAPVIHLGGGPLRFRELLRAQAALHPLPLAAAPTSDPGWLHSEEGFRIEREHEIESLFTVANGAIGSRGSLAEGCRLSAPATFVAGLYQAGRDPVGGPELFKIWNWAHLDLSVEGEPLRLEAGEILSHQRCLDLRQGIHWREWRQRDPAGRITRIEELRFASLADRHALGQSIRITPENYAGQIEACAVFDHPVGAAQASAEETPEGMLLLSLRTGGGAEVALVVADRFQAQDGQAVPRRVALRDGSASERWSLRAEPGLSFRLERLCALACLRDGKGDRPVETAARHCASLRDRGLPAILEAHAAAWSDGWETGDVALEGDPFAQRALRVARYHLLGSAQPLDERVSIGARALTGEAYKGHVFWETEIYMLPYFTFTCPEAARALLMYRWHTLPAARAKAARFGHRGALYAWESAFDGQDVTPSHVLSPSGDLVRIKVAEEEQHVSAAVAYGVWSYWHATGDDDFVLQAGAELVLETARFWASRAILEEDGRRHIRGVIGPDEYHESIDDDAYTNGMAAWNLSFGAELARTLAQRWPDAWGRLARRLGIEAGEPARWDEAARAMYTGFDPSTGLFEQFQGYFDLEDFDLATLEPRTAPVEVLLGREWIQRTQIVKQPDVVLLHYLLGDRYPLSVQRANFAYYEPRTGHGSSLSPPIHAAMAARLGHLETAERYFRQTAEIDLANNMGNAAGGVHAGALAGLWHAAVFGFAGLELGPDGPRFQARLPRDWSRMQVSCRWRGHPVRVTLGVAEDGPARPSAGTPENPRQEANP